MIATLGPKSSARTPPDLERTVRLAAEEVASEATTLTDLVASLTRDLDRGQQYALLRRLGEIGRRMNHTCGQLCHASDRLTRRPQRIPQ